MPARLGAAVCACVVLLSACGPDGAEDVTGPDAGPAPRNEFTTPLDSQTIASRLLYMHYEATALPPLARVIFYVDDASSPAGVDTAAPFDFACYDTTWQTGSWHTLSAVLDAVNGRKYFSDTLHVLIQPAVAIDTLLLGGRYSRTADRSYLITRLAYSWDAHLQLASWLESVTELEWSIAIVESDIQNRELVRALPVGSLCWLGGYLDGGQVWRWADSTAWTYDNWSASPPADSTRDGLAIEADGNWTAAARFAPLRIVLQARRPG